MKTIAFLGAFLLLSLQVKGQRLVRVEIKSVLMSPENALKVLSQKGKGAAFAEALIKKQEARLWNYSVLSVANGDKASVESFAEIIYRSEYEPPGGLGGLGRIPGHLKVPSVRTPTPAVFDTRKVGEQLEIEPSILEDGKTIALRISPEWAEYSRDTVWTEHRDAWGNADISFPEFQIHKHNYSVEVITGQSMLLGALKVPSQEGDSQAPQKMLVTFVKATIR